MLIKDIRNKMLRSLGVMLIVCTTSLLYSATNGESVWFFLDGGNVEQAWQTDASLGHCFCPYGQYGHYYLWSRVWKFPGNYGSISFRAKATNDIHVGVSVIDPWGDTSSENFYYTLVDSSNLYEFVIGGWGNGASVIRRGSQGSAIANVSGGIPLSPHTGTAVKGFVQYKIVFYQSPHNSRDTISVFYLNPHPAGNTKWTELMSVQDPSPITGQNRWVSFSSWDNPLFDVDIDVSSSVDLPPTH